MLKKKPVRGSDKVSVTIQTFELPNAREVGVAGCWNDWDPSRTPMRKRRDGAWAATVRFERGSRHEYRFVVDGERWFADPEADDHVANPFGGMNSVIQLREADD